MRPHRLRLRAFGPFAGEVAVDLDALAAGGLFLLHGETGAGKTTLLDALGFALYGRVPGARGKAARLRSDVADPAVRTEVELEVTLSGRRFRITRSPAQERPKARGAGTTTEQARILLEEQRDGGWATVSTRIDEAAAELDRHLGMSAEQFFQVVLLPQGEFAQFLRADSGKRGELLQRLFATERFSAVEDWLAGRRVATASAVAAARHDLDLLVARCAQVAAVEPPAEQPGEWVDALLAEARAAADGAAVATAAATAARDAARAVAAEAARTADLQARRAAALSRRAELDATATDRAALSAELAAAARAAELAAVLDEAAARTSAATTAGAAEATARAGLTAVGLPVDATVSAVRAAAVDAGRRTGRLEGLRAVADDLAAARSTAAAAHDDAAAAGARSALLAGRASELRAAQPAAAEALLAAVAAADALPALRAAQERRSLLLADAAELAVVTGRAAQLREEHVLARETLVSLREKESELREARLVSMIAELADRLVDGAPCEVCGATSHPDPYEGDGEGVTRDDEDRARLAAEQAARVVAEVEAQLAAEGAVAAALTARLGDVDAVALQQEAVRAGSVLTELSATAAGRSAAQQRVDALAQELATAEAERAAAQADGDAAGHRAQEATARAELLAGRLAGELDGQPDLDAALARAAAVVAAAEAVVQAAARAESAHAEAVRAAAAAETACTAASFASPAEAEQARRSPSWRAQAEADLRAAADALAAVEAVLTDPEVAAAGDQPVDVERAGVAVRAADVALREAGAAEAAATSRSAALADLAPQVQASLEALAPLEQTAALTRRMADLCAGGGSNALKMRLTSFVLAARLEDVAAAASSRLLRMTQGRYSLLHTDGAARGGARSGLGLLARDSWTGQDRDTATLSGGETFLASLALALGLADVVQAEAGGTRIDALFVDEGFGTLDEDTLDEVMDVLDGLREGGRVVGLVSHVAELRARIPAQVRVRKERGGSRLELVGV